MPIIPKGFNTTPCLAIHTCGYAGSDCATVTTEARFENNGPRPMLFLHESTSIGRPDIAQLVTHLIADGQITQGMLDDWKEMYHEMESSGDLQGLTTGSTYTPTINAIQLQMASSLNEKVQVTVKQKLRGGGARDVSIFLSRSWCPAIGNMQIEDPSGYGWPMKAVNFKAQKWKRSSMLTWALLAIISSLKELYHNVDQIVGGHSYKTPSGHLLTYIHHKLMKHCDAAGVKRSPFLSNMSQRALCSVVEDIMAYLNLK